MPNKEKFSTKNTEISMHHQTRGSVEQFNGSLAFSAKWKQYLASNLLLPFVPEFFCRFLGCFFFLKFLIFQFGNGQFFLFNDLGEKTILIIKILGSLSDFEYTSNTNYQDPMHSNDLK